MKRNVIFKCLIINIVISSIAAYIILDVPFPTKESIATSKKFERFTVGDGEIVHNKEQKEKITKYIENNKDRAVQFYPGITYKNWFLYYSMRFVVILLILIVISCVLLYLNNIRKKHA